MTTDGRGIRVRLGALAASQSFGRWNGMTTTRLIIYTDGSCVQKPRRGAYAYRLVAADPGGQEVIEDFSFRGSSVPRTTRWS